MRKDMKKDILDKPVYVNPIVGSYTTPNQHDMMTRKVACVWVRGPANYTIEHVKTLHRMVLRNTTGEIEFVCFTDHLEAYATLMSLGIKVIIVDPDVSGWWQKPKLFNKGHWRKNDRVMYIDLDTVITGCLDPLFGINHHTAAIANFGVNFKHSKYNSSVVVWDAHGPARRVWDKFNRDQERIIKALHGDQCWFWRVMLDDVHTFPPGDVISYKYEARKRGVRNARVICFHGKPDPWECKDKFIQEHYR